MFVRLEPLAEQHLVTTDYIRELRKFVHTNLPWAGFAFGSLEPQAGVLPIEAPLLVRLILRAVHFLFSVFPDFFCKQIRFCWLK